MCTGIHSADWALAEHHTAAHMQGRWHYLRKAMAERTQNALDYSRFSR